MRLFKAGTLVRVGHNCSKKSVAGKVGRVLENDSSRPFIEFKEHVNGHHCGGLCKDGYGWSVPTEYLREANIQLENK